MTYVTKYSDKEFGPFLVDDGTGTAYVDPENADLVLSSGDKYTVEGGEDPPAFISEFLERETDVDTVGRYERQYMEVRVDVDEQVRVAAETDPDSNVEIEEPVMTAILDGGDAPKFLVTDDTDLDLGSRMRQEALVYFLIAGVLFAFSFMFFYMG
jgi:hypothetical protein